MQAIVAAALEGYRRERFLRIVNAGYASLREDTAAWARVTEERALWDAVLLDGLAPEAGGGRKAPVAKKRGRARRRRR